MDADTTQNAHDQRKARKRDSILEAASRVFEDQGFLAASMDRVADLANASKRTVYNHFHSKEDLFRACYQRHFDEVRAKKRIPFDPDAPLEAQLLRFVEVKAGLIEDPRWGALFRAVLSVFVHNPALALSVIERAEVGERSLEAWLEAADASGRMRVADPSLAAEVFWGMVSGTLMWSQLLHGPMPRDRRQALADEVVATFLARYR